MALAAEDRAALNTRRFPAARAAHNSHYGVAAFCPFHDYRIAGNVIR
jgi:hypothetical protein